MHICDRAEKEKPSFFPSQRKNLPENAYLCVGHESPQDSNAPPGIGAAVRTDCGVIRPERERIYSWTRTQTLSFTDRT